MKLAIRIRNQTIHTIARACLFANIKISINNIFNKQQFVLDDTLFLGSSLIYTQTLDYYCTFSSDSETKSTKKKKSNSHI